MPDIVHSGAASKIEVIEAVDEKQSKCQLEGITVNGHERTNIDSRETTTTQNENLESLPELGYVTSASINNQTKSDAEMETENNYTEKPKDFVNFGNTEFVSTEEKVTCEDTNEEIRTSIEAGKTSNENLEQVIVETTDSSESGSSVSDSSGSGGFIQSTTSSDTAKTNEILAACTVNTEESLDSVGFPISTSESTHIEARNDNVEDDLNLSNDMLSPVSSRSSSASTPISTVNGTTIRPTVLSSAVDNSASVSAPIGQSSLHVSTDSSFLKVPSSDNSQCVDNNEAIVVNVNYNENQTAVTLQGTSDAIIQSGVMEPYPGQGSKVDSCLDANKSPTFSLFAPFSPFAQEIQSITSVQSPLAASQSSGINCPVSSIGKVRRITPIAIKGAEGKTDSQSSFQTVMENSPVLPDIPIVHSPFELSQPAVCSVVHLSGTPSNSLDGCPSFSNKVNNGDECSELQKLKLTSQKSNSSNTDAYSSQASTVSDPSYTSIVISQPNIFSENANVAFPKLNSSMTHAGIISEESLFQCLSKPSQFSETLQTVSNLTNILHALDGEAQDYELHAQSHPTKTITRDTNEDIASVEKGSKIFTYIYDTAAESIAHSGNLDNNLNTDKMESNIFNETDKTVSVITAVQESTNSRVSVHSSVQSRLSDSDTSRSCTPSVSATDVNDISESEQKSMSLMDVEETNDLIGISTTSSHLESAAGEIANYNSQEYDTCKSTTRTTIMNISEKATSLRVGHRVDSSVDSCFKRRHGKCKMSRRELRRSLHGKETCRSGSDDKDSVDRNSADVHWKEDKDEDCVPPNVEQTEEKNFLGDDKVVQCKGETDSGIVMDIDYKTENDNFLDGNARGQGMQNVNELNERLGKPKTEQECAFLSDVQSINAAVSEGSSRGLKKSKHKHRHKSDKERKKKKRKEDKESGSYLKTDKRKNKKSRKIEEEKQRKLETLKMKMSDMEPSSTDNNKVN